MSNDGNGLKKWVETQLVGLNGGDSLAGLNALSAAFQMACLEVTANGLPSHVDEEAMTGALLGAITATVPWCAAAYEARTSPGCSWIRYRKSGRSIADEPVTGADFALIIRLPDGTARATIFQAKRIKTKSTMDIHHISPEIEATATSLKVDAEAQFLRLKKYAVKAMAQLGKPSAKLSDLSWVHYLAYKSDRMPCYSLNQFSDLEIAYRNDPIGNPGAIKLELRNAVELLWLLTVGASEAPLPKGSGWLPLESANAATGFAKILIDIVDVYEAAVCPSDDYEPVLTVSDARRLKVGRALRARRLKVITTELIDRRPQRATASTVSKTKQHPAPKASNEERSIAKNVLPRTQQPRSRSSKVAPPAAPAVKTQPGIVRKMVTKLLPKPNGLKPRRKR